MRSYMTLRIGTTLILLLTSATICRSDEPLTPAEAAAWIRTECAKVGAARVSECAPLLELVVRYDQVEHDTPTVTAPAPLAVLTDDGTLHLSWPDPIVVDAAGVFRWALTPADVEIPSFHLEPWWPYAAAAGVGVLLGLVVGLIAG